MVMLLILCYGNTSGVKVAMCNFFWISVFFWALFNTVSITRSSDFKPHKSSHELQVVRFNINIFSRLSDFGTIFVNRIFHFRDTFRKFWNFTNKGNIQELQNPCLMIHTDYINRQIRWCYLFSSFREWLLIVLF